jgi:hypothetical protein
VWAKGIKKRKQDEKEKKKRKRKSFKENQKERAKKNATRGMLVETRNGSRNIGVPYTRRRVWDAP